MPINKLRFHNLNAHMLLEINRSNAFRLDAKKLQHTFQFYFHVSKDELWNSIDYLIGKGYVIHFISGTHQYHGIQLLTKGFQVLIGEVIDENVCI